MTEADVQTIAVEDLPVDIEYGTAAARRYAIAHIKYVSAAASDTITLGNYVGVEVADIVGVVYDTMNNATSSTATTWSSGTASCAADGGAGAGEIGIIFRYT